MSKQHLNPKTKFKSSDSLKALTLISVMSLLLIKLILDDQGLRGIKNTSESTSQQGHSSQIPRDPKRTASSDKDLLHPATELVIEQQLEASWPLLLAQVDRLKSGVRSQDHQQIKPAPYIGLLGSPIQALDRTAKELNFSRTQKDGLPRLAGMQSIITLQAAEGMILGADISFDAGATSASWGMIVEALAGGANLDQADPMMMIDDLSDPSRSSLPQGHNIEVLKDQRKLLGGVWMAADTHKMRYALELTSTGEPVRARLWIIQ